MEIQQGRENEGGEKVPPDERRELRVDRRSSRGYIRSTADMPELGEMPNSALT